MNRVTNINISTLRIFLVGIGTLLLSLCLTSYAHATGGGIDDGPTAGIDMWADAPAMFESAAGDPVSPPGGGGGGGQYEIRSSPCSPQGCGMGGNDTVVPYTFSCGPKNGVPAVEMTAIIGIQKGVRVMTGWAREGSVPANAYNKVLENSGSSTGVANDRIWRYNYDVPIQQKVFLGYNCGYPTWKVAENKTCYNNFSGLARTDRDLAAIRAGGTTLFQGSLPGPTAQGPNPCQDFANPRLNVPLKDYAYYRLSVYADYHNWQKENLSYGSTVYDSRWNKIGSGTRERTRYFSYSCNTSTGDPFKMYESYAGLTANPTPNFFDPALCPQVSWKCELADSTTAGIDRATIPAGTTRVTRPVSVMRNGDPVTLTFSKVNILDTTNGGRVSVGEGQTGRGVRNLTTIAYRDMVKGRGAAWEEKNNITLDQTAKSTPWNSNVDINNANQYFTMYKKGTNTQLQWDRWNTGSGVSANAADRRNVDLTFNWSSDKGSSFVALRNYSVTAEFLVPRGAQIGIDGNGNPIYSDVRDRWVKDTRLCKERDSSGKETSKLLTAIGNPIEVIRSTNK